MRVHVKRSINVGNAAARAVAFGLAVLALAGCGAGTGSSSVGGAGGTGTAQAPTVVLNVDAAAVASGASVTFTWFTVGATACTASGAWSGSKATAGSETVGPLTASGTYVLTCSGSGGSTNQSIAIAVAANAAPTLTLSANPTTVNTNGASTLTWSSTNATSCTASGAWTGSKATSGSQSVGPLTVTGTYTLNCSGTGGTVNKSATITVNATTATLSGSVDSSLIDRDGQNAVYVYSGNVTPDDTGSGGANPVATAAVTQENGSCRWSYQLASLPVGTYTVAFTKQAANDNAATNDNIGFVGTAPLNVQGASASHNFAATRVLRVGAGKPYAKPSNAAAAALDGDVIEIDAGTYDSDAATWARNNLTLRGVGSGRAHLRANGAAAQGKGIWVIAGSNVSVENIEFSNAAVPSHNGAGIRAEGQNLTICNSYFHDNENGILGGAGNVLIEYSEFARNGGCVDGFGCSHNMYISQNTNRFTLRHSYSHHANVGHTLKSRAKENYILYNRIMDEATGSSSYNIDLSNGGLSFIIGNLIHQGAATENPTMVAYGLEGLSNPSSELYMVNNTLVNDLGSGSFVTTQTGTTARIINNLLVGAGTTLSGPGQLTTNLKTSSPGFVNMGAYDYHLTGNSPARDTGSNPGTASNGFSLVPLYHYAGPNNRVPRVALGVMDVGAYEYAP